MRSSKEDAVTSNANNARRLVMVLVITAALAQAAREIKPGWNLFSREQDVELGKQASQEIEKQVQVVNDQQLTNYVAGLGKRLAANSQAPDYPYTFKVVADESINAFALPGGPIYVHSGVIAAADNEAQLAGVMAHEIGHVALRHSTNQISKARAWQIPLAIASGALDRSGGMLGSLAQMGIGLGVNSLFLRYSRDAEKDADIVGAHTMAKTGYDPIEMARFFEKLEKEGGGSGGPQFLSDHPNPGNRVAYVTEEVRQMPQASYGKGSGDFSNMRARAQKIKATKPAQQPGRQRGGDEGASSSGTRVFEPFRGLDYELAYPESWRVFAAKDGSSVTIAPSNGAVQQSGGGTAIARGILAGYFNSRANSLGKSTDELIADLQASNPQLQPLRGQRRSTSIGGQAAESILLDGPSALPNQQEMVWLVTAQRPQGLFYLLMISPQNEYDALRGPYEQVLKSVRFVPQQTSR
jgi:Zn-dependent protease with chaperone function